MSTPVLSPSLLSADFSDLAGALKVIESAGSGAVHIDVMDGKFVEKNTYNKIIKDPELVELFKSERAELIKKYPLNLLLILSKL